jgi:hypothetical protein
MTDIARPPYLALPPERREGNVERKWFAYHFLNAQ